MELQYDPAGRTLLKVTGVLMIVFGALGALLYLLGLAAVIGLTYATSGIFSGTDDLIGMSLLLAGAIVELITGILGVRAVKKPERTGPGRLVWGILCLLLTLAGLGHIALRQTAAPLWEILFGMALGVVVPILYLVGVRILLKGPVLEAEKTSENAAEAEE